MVVLDDVLVKEITEHALREAPLEACGIVASEGGRPVRVFTMSNADRSSFTYRLDAREQLEVFEEISRRGWELHAIYHSHVRTAAYPSDADMRLAFYPDAHYLVVSLQDPDVPEIRSFRIVSGEILEEEVLVP